GIAAAAGGCGVKLQAEVVPAEEPVESALSLLVPPRVRGGAVGIQTGGHHRLRLDRLLVEVRAGSAARVKSAVADGPEIAALRCLHLRQPAQRLQSTLKHRLS